MPVLNTIGKAAIPQFAGKLILWGADEVEKMYPTIVPGVKTRLLISVGGGLLLAYLGAAGKLRGGWSAFALVVGTYLLTDLVDVARSYMGTNRLGRRTAPRMGARPVNITPAVAPGIAPTEVAIY
jgi:hypothetical protein